MSFLHKQPCVLPRVLCASQCPSDNKPHDIDEFPLYYDPLYYPACYRTLFNSKKMVCQWLLHHLQEHPLMCPSCPYLEPVINGSHDTISYTSSIFDIILHGVHLQVPLSYVECSRFSFCRLYRRFLILMSSLQCPPSNLNPFLLEAQSVLVQVPGWFLREKHIYLMSLSALSVVQRKNPIILSKTDTFLKQFSPRRSRGPVHKHRYDLVKL